MEHDLNPSDGLRARRLARTLVQRANLGEEGIAVAVTALQIAVLDVVAGLDRGGVGMEIFIHDLRLMMAALQARSVPRSNLH